MRGPAAADGSNLASHADADDSAASRKCERPARRYLAGRESAVRPRACGDDGSFRPEEATRPPVPPTASVSMGRGA
jgi:hypothetical protein